MADQNPFSDPNFGAEQEPAPNPFANPEFGKEATLTERVGYGAKRALNAARTTLTDDPAKIAQIAAEQAQAAPPQSAAARQMDEEIKPYKDAANNAEGVVEGVKTWGALGFKRLGQWVSNPGEAVKVIAEQLPNSLPGLAAGWAGAKAGAAVGTAVAPGPGTVIGAVVGGVGGGLAGGYLTEKGASVQEQVQEKAQAQGVNIQDQAAVANLVKTNQSEIDTAATLKGVGTAGTDAVLNVLTVGLSGMGRRMLGNEISSMASAVKAGQVTAADAAKQLATLEARAVAQGAWPAVVGRGAAVTGAEMLGEGVSEAVGQKLAYGKVDAGEVVDESLLGLGQGVATSALSGAANRIAGTPSGDENLQAIAALRESLKQPDAPPLLLGNTGDPMLVFPDGTVARRSEFEAYIGALPETERVAARAQAYGFGPQGKTPEELAQAEAAAAAAGAAREQSLARLQALSDDEFAGLQANLDAPDNAWARSLLPNPAPTAQQLQDGQLAAPADAGLTEIGRSTGADSAEVGRYAEQARARAQAQINAGIADEATARLAALSDDEVRALDANPEAPASAWLRGYSANPQPTTAQTALTSIYADADQAETEINQSTGAAPPAQLPSQAMGLNPAAGPISAAAVRAVDGGASTAMAQAAQAQAQTEAAAQAEKQPKTAAPDQLQTALARLRAERGNVQDQAQGAAAPVAQTQAQGAQTAPAVGGDGAARAGLPAAGAAATQAPVVGAPITNPEASTNGTQTTQAQQAATQGQQAQPAAAAVAQVEPGSTQAPVNSIAQGAINGQPAGQVAGAASPGVAGQPQATLAEQGAAAPGAGDVAVGQAQRGVGGQPAGAIAVGDQPAAGGATRTGVARAKSAPILRVRQMLGALFKERGVQARQVAEPIEQLSAPHQVASAIAQMLGKTYTVVERESGPSQAMPNGFINALGGNDIYVDKDTVDGPLFVVIHEAYHGLPDAVRLKLNAALGQLFRQELRGEFERQFGITPGSTDEEIPAYMAQAISRREDFWTLLQQKMGNGDFSEVARYILQKLNSMVRGMSTAYGEDFLAKYVTDVTAARDLLAEAYADAMRAQGKTPAAVVTGGGLVASSKSRRGAETIGDFQVTTAKDGAINVFGDAEQIRALIPEGIKGRPFDDGITFTNAVAPQVRNALSGRKVAYSRAGQVTERLPMRNGTYLGAPEKFNTPGKIPTLRKWLRQLADEGAPGRFWYENSSREVLRMVGGNVQEARRFVALLAIYSPQAKVDANSTFALRAWAQYKAGQPISVKTGTMDAKAKAALDNVDAFWSGEKTGNFFFNLLREIDPSTAGKQGATIDMWMMRAGQYSNDAPTATQYSFMENETNRLAAELGWEPQQVQAAIWVAMKARMENKGVKQRTEAISEKKGWIRFVPGKDGKGKVRDILDAQKHRDNWLAQSFEHDPTKDDTRQAKFDFSDGVLRHIGQISFEARPGRSTGALPGIHSAPYAQQVEFQQAVQAAFLDEQGRDILAHRLGLLVDNDILTPGVWQGEVSPSGQKLVAMAPAKGADGKTRVDPAQRNALDLYATVAGLVGRQEGVGWHRPFYSGTRSSENGVDLNIGRAMSPDEASNLWRAIDQRMRDAGVSDWDNKAAMVSTPTGMRVVNFGALEDNKDFQTLIKEAAADLSVDELLAKDFTSDGNLVTNDWKAQPNGESYRSRLSEAGRSDLHEWARDVLAPKVQAVYADFSQRYGWGDPGRLQFSSRAAGDGGRRSEGAGAADRQAVPQQSEGAGRGAGQGQGSQQKLTPLPGAPKVPGFHGPDPRLVAVAERYARDNGITLRRQAEYAQIDPERAKRLAEAYAAMPHAPNDPTVREAYENLIRQTRAQYQALANAGYKFWFIDLDQPSNAEYASSPWNAMRDVRANQQMGVFPTEAGFGSGDALKDNPLETTVMDFTWPSGSLTGPSKRVLANDLFRAVHDAFGHGLEGSGFRAQGEENAWQAHVRLFTGSAVGAITSETRGQNSWLNYGPNGETNRTAQVEDTVFADQKTGLMPEWTWTEGRVGDAPMFSNRDQTETPEFKRWSEGLPVHSSFEDRASDRGIYKLFHMTTADFDEFKPGGRNPTDSGPAIWLSADPSATSAAFRVGNQERGFRSGARTMPVYAKVKNPLVIDDKGMLDYARESFANGSREFPQLISKSTVDALKNDGYDSVIFDGPGVGWSSASAEVIVLDGKQIKSAIGNNGQFDPENADIRFSSRARDVGPTGLYSELSRQVDKFVMRSAAPDGWKQAIKGMVNKGAVKADEVEWSGLADWLDMQAGKVSKDQVLEYLRGNGVQVEEVVLGDQSLTAEERSELRRLESLGEDELDDRSFNRLQDLTDRSGSPGQSTKYGQYQLLGGENYREVLLTLPMQFDAIKAEREFSESMQQKYPMSVAARLRAMQPDEIAEWDRLKAQANAQADKNAGYKSNHWDQPNVLAHIRVNDRTDADGKRVLFVEEIQSDWGQEGKKKGFALTSSDLMARPFEGGMANRWEVLNRRTGERVAMAIGQSEQEAIQNGLVQKPGVPTAPFVTKTDGWLNLALKRVIAMAVDGGYDAVAFTTGAQNAERFSLDKQLDALRWGRVDANRYSIGMKRKGYQTFEDSGIHEASALERVVGKEIAERIVSSDADGDTITGDGLKVEAKGMRSFYDAIIPNAVKALLKKVGGGQVEMIEIDDRVPGSEAWMNELKDEDILKQPGFTITDTMREKVSTEGLPMFSNRAAGSTWDTPAQSRFDDVVYKMQDKLIDVKRVVESITAATGRIADDINVYLQEELFHGRAAKRVADFGSLELKPVLNQMRLAGLEIGDMEEFLHARHAREANALIASREPSMPDGGSGMTNAAADAYMRALPADQRRKLEAVASRVDAIIAQTRQLYADYGLEDQATVDGWGQMFKAYVPLMREDKDGGMGIGQGFSVKGKETKGRTGSTRKVVDILANVAMQRERVIVRGEKNRVGQALLGLAQANPNPEFWEVRSQPPTERVYDPKTNSVVDRPDNMFKSQPNVLTAKVKDASGKVVEQAVVFAEDNDRAVRMATAMKNLDSANLEGLLGVSAKITRYFAAVNTQYNPVFGVVNLVRDVQGAMANLAATPLAGKQAQVARDTISALAGIYRDVRATRKGGQATSPWAQLWEQMQADGGTTGYRELFKTSAERAEALQSIIEPDAWMRSTWGKVFTADGRLKMPVGMAMSAARPLFDWLSDYNEAMENGVRLAAYKAALDQGMSRQQAASLSKNLTVNFNRKGQVGQQAGALYAFFNAAMQGTARLGATLVDMDGGNPKTMRLSSVGKKVVYGGMMLGSIQALMLAAAGFDDEDPPEFVRERSLIIPTGGKTYITIPMPLGLHVIPGLGRHATEFALSGFEKPAKRVIDVAGMFADAFNPIGNAGLSIQTIAPTPIDPLVALSENRDWTGKPIARTSNNPAVPGHSQWKDTATGWSKVIAEGINLMTGGNQYVAGVVSPTPDQIDYLIAQVTGGVGREISKVEQTARAAISGEELPTYKVPLLGRFVGNAASQASEGNAFYSNVQRINEIETELKGLRKDGRGAEAAELARSRPEARLILAANLAEREVQKLRRDKRALIEKGAERGVVKAKDEQITAVMARLNRAAARVVAP